VHTSGAIRSGGKTLETADGATAGNVLQRGLIRFREDEKENGIKKLFDSSVILINGKNIQYLEGLDTVISENNTMIILKPFVGG
jgi:molybdopterin converting factor small subunit